MNIKNLQNFGKQEIVMVQISLESLNSRHVSRRNNADLLFLSLSLSLSPSPCQSILSFSRLFFSQPSFPSLILLIFAGHKSYRKNFVNLYRIFLCQIALEICRLNIELANWNADSKLHICSIVFTSSTEDFFYI